MVIKKIRFNKRAQLSLFVILGILVIIIVIIFFTNKESLKIWFGKESPLEYINRCTKDYANEGLEMLKMQGGSINPENYYMYQNYKVGYVCYTSEIYKRCVMQKPFLKEDFEVELKKFLTPRIEECLKKSEEIYGKKGYSFSYKKPDVNVSINFNNILIKSNLDMVIDKDGKKENYKDLNVNIDSGLYELLMIESSIANWEARYGDSESMVYMYYYPNLKVEKKIQSDGTRIYILTNRKTNEKLMFASKSVVFPPGVTGS